MKRYRVVSTVAFVILAGCEQPEPVQEPEPKVRCQYDQDIRREILMECLRVVPAGPAATKYNDWSEVVEECGDQAGYLSLRGCRDTRAKSDTHVDSGERNSGGTPE